MRDKIYTMTVPIGNCLIWVGASLRNGYGQVRYKGVSMGAHRASYLEHKGEIPDGYVVKHLCDNPLCVHPDHLSLGTVKDNVDDKVAKGRHRNGHGRRFTEDEKEYIRSSTKSQRELAKELGCTQPAISKIRNKV